VAAGETVRADEVLLKSLATKPPARFNEATLLSAMEGAGKMVDDEELRAAMGERGLGTPATRAQTIEGLILEQYVHREGRELIPSAKAFSLITLLKGLGVSSLTSPELTGEWEHKLAQMERGSLSRPAFMHEIAEMAREIVERAKRFESDTVPGDFVTLATPCPKCAGVVKENYKKFACQACDSPARPATGAPGKSSPDGSSRSTKSRRCCARAGSDRCSASATRWGVCSMPRFGSMTTSSPSSTSKQPEFDFGQPKDDESAEPVDFSGQQSLGPCPKCNSAVYEHGLSFVCEKSVGPGKSCDFRSGKIILQQPIERDQMVKLLAEGRTELLKGFVSSRTRRKFSAFLVRGTDGKVGFEFEAKKPRATAKREDEGADASTAAAASKPAPRKRTAKKAE